MSGCTFRGANLSDSVMTAARIERTHFEAAQCYAMDATSMAAHKCEFAGADLQRVVFIGGTVSGCSFHGARIDHSSWQKASIVDSQFEEALLENADFEGATLNDCRRDHS